MPCTAEQFELICTELETSTFGVRRVVPLVCPDLDVKQFYRFLNSSEKNCQRYARAKEKQLELLADEIIDIADDASNDFMKVVKNDIEYEVENKELTKRSVLRVDSRKWLLSKLLPKKYGDKLDLNHAGNVTLSIADQIRQACGETTKNIPSDEPK